MPTEAEGPARWLDAQGYGDSVTWTGDRFATTGFIYTPGCLDDPSRCPGPANLSSPNGFMWAEMTGPDGKQGSEGKAWTARSVASLLGHTVVVGQQGRRLEVWLYETPAAVADHAAGTLGQRFLQ